MKTRYVIQVESAAALPAYLLKRLEGDHRLVNPDTRAPHDLCLEGIADADAIWMRSFAEEEAIEACREWGLVQPQLDVMVAEVACTLTLIAAEEVLLSTPRPLLRLLPLVDESGQRRELRCSVPAWPSARRRETDDRALFVRPHAAPAAPTMGAEVLVPIPGLNGSRRWASSRVGVDLSEQALLSRFEFAEIQWLGSHFAGLDLLNPMRRVMTPAQAVELKRAMLRSKSGKEARVIVKPISEFVGTGEFEAGVLSRPPAFQAASRDLCDLVGVPVIWVVWP